MKNKKLEENQELLKYLLKTIQAQKQLNMEWERMIKKIRIGTNENGKNEKI